MAASVLLGLLAGLSSHPAAPAYTVAVMKEVQVFPPPPPPPPLDKRLRTERSRLRRVPTQQSITSGAGWQIERH